jgi:hypothetical protein
MDEKSSTKLPSIVDLLADGLLNLPDNSAFLTQSTKRKTAVGKKALGGVFILSGFYAATTEGLCSMPAELAFTCPVCVYRRPGCGKPWHYFGLSKIPRIL